MNSVEEKNNADIAASHHGNGFGCTQALLLTYGPKFGIDPKNALKIATGFAGGMARMGGICGVITGAMMIIGLAYGKVEAGDDDAKEMTYYYIDEFIDEFRLRHPAITCKELIHLDLREPEGLRVFRQEKVMQTICPKFVKDAAEILDEILE